MRLVLSLLCLSSIVPQLEAASLTIHPVELVRAIHAKGSPSTKFRRIGEAVLMAGDLVDWRTTLVATQELGLCEKNRFLTSSTCILNKPKFNVVKGIVAGFVVAQELPVWKKHQEGWNRTFTIVDFSVGVPMLITGFNNWRIIEKHR